VAQEQYTDVHPVRDPPGAAHVLPLHPGRRRTLLLLPRLVQCRHHQGLSTQYLDHETPDRRHRRVVVPHRTPAGTETDGGGPIQYLEARHRGHARVEDRIRCGKDTGFGRFPSRAFAINAAWLELALTAIDLLAWTQLLLLDGDLSTAEPKKLRYRLLHVAARITRTARQNRLRITETRPWATNLTTAFARLAALPQPIT
jgi:hypothetical protein